MKVLMLWEYYPIYLSYFYQKYPEVLDLPFEEHRQRIFDDHFGWPADLSQYMNQQGIETEFIIANAETLQKRWAKEQGGNSFNEHNWEKAIALEQIRRFSPDILWKINPTDDFDVFLDDAKGSYRKVWLYLGHKIPKLDLLGKADYLITPQPKRILKHYPQLRNLANVHSGFSPTVLDQIGEVKKIYDIVFIGNITPEHQRRAEVLAYLIENGINLKVFGGTPGLGRKYMLKKGIENSRNGKLGQGIKLLAKAFLGSEYKKHAEVIKTVLQPPVFGLDYYRTIAQARLALNIHIDMAEGFTGNMRMFETTGVGTCLITEDVEATAEIFKHGKEILTFSSKEHLLDLLQKIDFGAKQIQDIARAGQHRTLNDYSINRMFDQIQAIIQ